MMWAGRSVPGRGNREWEVRRVHYLVCRGALLRQGNSSRHNEGSGMDECSSREERGARSPGAL